jgi:hypothetical protein
MLIVLNLLKAFKTFNPKSVYHLYFRFVKRYSVIAILLLAFAFQASSQTKGVKIVQFSGYVLTADSLIGVPFAHITVMNRGRVAEAGPDGFFSFAAVEGDTLFFTSVGFKPAVYIVPTKLEGDKYSVIQPMTRDAKFLPTTYIFPWRREDFREIFINTHPPETLMEIARKNLDRETLRTLSNKTAPDGPEQAAQLQRSSSAAKYYYGQVAPQNIFNPLAWAQFIQAWKNGDFKKKNDPGSGTPAPVDPNANPQY